MTTPLVDGQWLDFYALLDVPVNADEDTIRKRIGKVYAEAAANSDHRDFSRRSYYQALVERVLPQCRRVLLDPEWRAKYDRQHILHGIGDPSAQDYVSFIASMRGGEAALASALNPDANLPQRVQDEITLARQVVETARAGAQLELLPSRAVKVRPEAEHSEPETLRAQRPQSSATPSSATQAKPEPLVRRDSTPREVAPREVALRESFNTQTEKNEVAARATIPENDAANSSFTSPRFEKSETTEPSNVETIYQPGEPARAKTLTAKEAADIRRRRNSNPDAEPYVEVDRAAAAKKNQISRVVVEDTATASKPSSRLVSPTSLNLMVAITGVLLTITIQKFAMTPAEATNSARLRMVVVTSPEIAPLVSNAADSWEQTRDGAGFDVVVEPLDGTNALNRVRGKNGGVPDAWIPANSVWTKASADSTSTPESIAQSAMVLIASSDSASPLLKMCGRDKGEIPSWEALRAAMGNLNGGFGLPDPQGSSVGAFARLSMAREWGAERNLDAAQAAKSPQFWRWMRAFEDKVPSGAFSSVSMIKGIAEGTSDRYKWVIGYESDVEGWKKAGKSNLKYFYLPRTIIADYPFYKVNNVRASIEVENGREAFSKYLRNPKVQATLGNSGFRPSEVKANSSLTKLGNLPREEKFKPGPVNTLTTAWARAIG